MGKSFVLRDRTGTAMGCLMQGLDAMHLSFRGARESDEIVLLMKDGTWKKRRIGQQADGGGWMLEMSEAEGVVMLRGGEIVADSGEKVRLRFETERRGTRKAEQAARQTTPETTEKRTERSAPGKHDERENLPEQRWPPPPCLAQAVYRAGAWKLENE